MNSKKLLLVIALILTLSIIAGCAYLPMAGMTSMLAASSSSGTSVTADPDSIAAGGDTVTITREEYERYLQFEEMIEMMQIVDTYYIEDVDHTKMLQGAAAGLLKAVDDPYTFYYTPEEYASMWENDEGNYVGIGIQISGNYQTQICTVTRVFEGGPAFNAGVKKGDILYRVGDDLYVNADNLDDAVSIMRGEPGTDVTVAFLRNGEELTFTMTRASVTTNRVESCMLTADVGYIYLYEFAGDCATEFEKALNGVMAQGAKGLIIDLRDNGGGWVNDAQSIADLFLGEGVLCYLENKQGAREYYYTKAGELEIPLVILVNEHTASSSEILSGCLRDRADAAIVGVQSYGKGIVQIVLPVGRSGAGMQVTEAQYYTPSGHAVHKIGITPNVVVEVPEGSETMYQLGDLADIQLAKALEVMQMKMNGERIPDPAEPAKEE